LKQIISTLTSKGQVTVPAEVRHHLGVREGDKILFVVDDEGNVHVEVPQYATLESLVGAAGSLPEPLTWEQVMEIVDKERVGKYAQGQGSDGGDSGGESSEGRGGGHA
jgi:antitoxin PrlF